MWVIVVSLNGSGLYTNDSPALLPPSAKWQNLQNLSIVVIALLSFPIVYGQTGSLRSISQLILVVLWIQFLWSCVHGRPDYCYLYLALTFSNCESSVGNNPEQLSIAVSCNSAGEDIRGQIEYSSVRDVDEIARWFVVGADADAGVPVTREALDLVPPAEELERELALVLDYIGVLGGRAQLFFYW